MAQRRHLTTLGLMNYFNFLVLLSRQNAALSFTTHNVMSQKSKNYVTECLKNSDALPTLL